MSIADIILVKFMYLRSILTLYICSQSYRFIVLFGSDCNNFLASLNEKICPVSDAKSCALLAVDPGEEWLSQPVTCWGGRGCSGYAPIPARYDIGHTWKLFLMLGGLVHFSFW